MKILGQHEIFYWEVTGLWKELCCGHIALLEEILEEYSHLLSNDIEALETCVRKKEQFLERLKGLEKKRQDLICKFNTSLKGDEVTTAKALLTKMREFDVEKNQKHFFRFHSLLLDLIAKIQSQNKRNQFFINKILYSLKAIQEGAKGESGHLSYNTQGVISG